MGDNPEINPLNEDGTPKTAKQLKKEAEKAAKMKKFLEKQEAMKAAKAAKEAADKAKPKGEADKKAEKKKEKEVVTYDLDTPPGAKKDVSVELPAQYSPRYVEKAWYEWWKKEGFFNPDYKHPQREESNEDPFVMVIPPPNVTGTLHLGHALTNAVEDAIARWHRMSGRTTLWVPGCDHAGIATQVAVEKKVKREEGKTRHDLGREEFVKRVWQWKEEKGGRIYDQLERMGSSLDWSRACFTMDAGPQRAVAEAFVRLHSSGDIYRAHRLVNWSCSLKSAISDIEVEKKELTGRTELAVPGHSAKVEFGVLVEFAYPVEGGRLVVATTRVETMLGDTAVAVHPEDERYKHLHGKSVTHPITGATLPIVADDFVDREFGTGAVKITPAHDANDYEVGKRHNLPFVNILTDDGKIVEGFGEFSGLPRFEARVKVLEKLKELGCYVGTNDNEMAVPFCSRSKDVVEPMLKPQWYVRCGDMAADALEVVKTGELQLIPATHEKTWSKWLTEIRDWCISRQLWWGHRIPAYYASLPGDKEGAVEDPKRWMVAHTEAEALAKACKELGVEEKDITLRQDPDVLDTWFSSALFPFACLGWPNKTSDLERFYPGALLETGHDILFFWVARMVFFGRKLMGKLPFKQVYLHAMVRDSHGRKMSKSLGNVIDPMDVINGITLQELFKQLEQNTNLDPREIEKAKKGQKDDYPQGIPECGTDALRFALCAYTSQGRDINLDVLRVNGYRNFCNKLWNATKFALMQLGADFTPLASLQELKDMCRSGRSQPTTTQLDALNQHLSTRSYLVGYEPSQYDALVYNNTKEAPVEKRHIHTRRWQRHIQAHTEAQRSAFPLLPANQLPPSLSGLARTGNSRSAGLRTSDRWLLSSLSSAVATCNAAFQSYSFPEATSSLHQLWWSALCDTYLETLKPRLYGDHTDGPDAMVARQVLYTALHTALRLISPFMPFLSEELFQRLPSRPSSTPAPSVCVAPYPRPEEYAAFADPAAEEGFRLAQRVVAEVRSAKAKYGLGSKTKVDVTLTTSSPAVSSTLSSLTQEISTLSVASSVQLADGTPEGAVPTAVGADCVAWIKLQGVIDTRGCSERISAKRDDCAQKLEKLKTDMLKPEYEKVPEDIKTKNSERLKELEAERLQFDDAVTQLEKLNIAS